VKLSRRDLSAGIALIAPLSPVAGEYTIGLLSIVTGIGGQPVATTTNEPVLCDGGPVRCSAGALRVARGRVSCGASSNVLFTLTLLKPRHPKHRVRTNVPELPCLNHQAVNTGVWSTVIRRQLYGSST